MDSSAVVRTNKVLGRGILLREKGMGGVTAFLSLGLRSVEGKGLTSLKVPSDRKNMV